MSKAEKICILSLLREHYSKEKRKEKSAIISEVCERFNVCRKHAIRLLSPRGRGRPRKPDKRGRPPKYQDKTFKEALRKVWKIVSRARAALLLT